MAATGARGLALANIGLADLLLWSGDTAGVETNLLEGIKSDEAASNTRAVATKKIILADTYRRQGKGAEQVAAQIAESLALSSSLSNQVPAALLYLALGKEQEAADIAARLGGQLNAQQRAYARLIGALLLQAKGENIAAIESLQEAVGLADLWLVRYYLGQAYFNGEHYAEAVSEFFSCKERLGEAYSLFLDDTPTFRYTVELDDWLKRARANMTSMH